MSLHTPTWNTFSIQNLLSSEKRTLDYSLFLVQESPHISLPSSWIDFCQSSKGPVTVTHLFLPHFSAWPFAPYVVNGYLLKKCEVSSLPHIYGEFKYLNLLSHSNHLLVLFYELLGIIIKIEKCLKNFSLHVLTVEYTKLFLK